ncbi:MAG: hydrogenase iron-sulfur subunit [Thermodesulfobacteriota bacterium]
MPRPVLCWLEGPGLEGLDPAQVARAAGLELDRGGVVEAAVATAAEAQAPEELKRRLLGKAVQWLDLAAEVGGGDAAHRLARAAAAVARAAGRAALGTLAPVYAPQPAQRVLVAGHGLAALLAAQAAAALGHPVLLAGGGADIAAPAAGEDPDEAVRLAATLPAGVEPAPGVALTGLTGAAGAFTAWLDGPEGRSSQRFGAVILAPAAAWAVEPAPAGLDPALARPLDELSPADLPPGQGWRQVALFCGLGAPATPEAFARALAKAIELQAQPLCQVCVFFREALVAAPGGERLYRQAREAGVLMVRLAEGGADLAASGRVLAWRDPILGEDLELTPDLVGLAQTAVAAAPDFLANPVLWPEWSRLMPEHARLGGGRTARSGLYVLGALRGGAQGDLAAQAAAAAADLHDLLGGAATPMPVVRHNHCASCLTCVRVCPHGAPRYEVDCITPAPAACVGCGVCAAECPAEAIAPPGWSNAELTEALRRGLAAAPRPALVLMACGQSALPAMRELSLSGHQWPAGLLALPLPCAGRAGLELILRALSLGASGVLVAGCHDGVCRSISGNLRARLRVGEAAKTLAELGLGPNAVSFLHLAGNQPQALKQAVAAMHGRLAPVE